MLPVLEPAIWDHICRFLHRSQPPARTTENWADLHQGDLAVMMRVNTMYHDIAGRVLYAEPVVADLPSFFLGITTSSIPKRSRFTTKSELLQHTHSLHLIYHTKQQSAISPPTSGSTTITTAPSSSKGKRSLNPVREREEQFWATMMEASSQDPPLYISGVQQLTDLLEKLKRPVLPNLRILTTGKHGVTLCPIEMTETQKMAFLPMSKRADYFPLVLCANSPPIHWCRRISTGPLGGVEPELFTRLRDVGRPSSETLQGLISPTFTDHHTQGRLVFRGYSNRFIETRRWDMRMPRKSHVEQLGKSFSIEVDIARWKAHSERLQRAVERNKSRWGSKRSKATQPKAVDPAPVDIDQLRLWTVDTQIIVYGYLESLVDPKLVNSAPQWTSYDAVRQPDFVARQQEIARRAMGGGWANELRLESMKEAGACPACGLVEIEMYDEVEEVATSVMPGTY